MPLALKILGTLAFMIWGSCMSLLNFIIEGPYVRALNTLVAIAGTCLCIFIIWRWS